MGIQFKQPITMQRIRVAQLLVRTTIRISRSGTQRWNSSSSSGAQPAMTDGEQHIINKLTGRFKPSRLQVQDVSGAPLVRRMHLY